ncbi:MAG: hypothetical protein BAJATHORv1_10470 [Candidatus Thorarchaeota archaeon]|nr:MAG: hypothetical protein BAJATHORv1_10470 [Candidatus Thorarchaeota archaeon]
MTDIENEDSISIRLRLSNDILEKIDLIAGERGRQRFIEDAVKWRLLWKLDEDVPPIITQMLEDIIALQERVTFLEQERASSMYLGGFNDVTNDEICRDDLDRKIIAHLLQYEGATTPELAQWLLGSETKRRTILDRLNRLNSRFQEVFGKEVLHFEQGIFRGKRGAWWIKEPKLITD